ncbi:hypothetical protein [Actinomyces urinae]|uniref:hypothetical protein n=1 Tax=Actinomyces urinae TaxID=1689268 RepID=UPI0009319EB2|nr:hypothetical protein [Actinomyces urinae]
MTVEDDNCFYLPDDDRLYEPDYDWLWTYPPHNDGSEARLRIVLQRADDGSADSSLLDLVHSWLDTLLVFEESTWGAGGWAVRLVYERSDRVLLELWSAGEDVADGLQAGTESLFAGVLQDTDVQVTYEQLPRI